MLLILSYVSLKTKIIVDIILGVFILYFLSAIYSMIGWTFIPNVRRLKISSTVLVIVVICFVLIAVLTFVAFYTANRLY